RKSSRSLVGLMADRSPNLLVGLMAILKAGSAVVPIDPKHPLERMDFIIKDCDIEILITERRYLEKAEKLSNANGSLKHVGCIDDVDQTTEADNASRDSTRHCAGIKRVGVESTAIGSDVGHGPDDLLYVIYTSGSTGNPKGVPISNSNVLPLLLWSGEYFGLG